MFKANVSKMQNLPMTLALVALLVFGGGARQVFAHGGEDHGDAQPKVAANAKGVVSRSARLGEFELTFKTPALEPDAATAAKLFVTKYETNEAVSDGSVPTMEIESAGGTMTQVAVEKTDVAGSYNLKIPALPEGNYTIRTNLKSAKGSDTATFSNVEVAHHEAANADATGGAMSWLRTILFFTAGAIVLALFGGLFYFARRMAAGEKSIGGGEAVSA
jgi:hypothetical protein